MNEASKVRARLAPLLRGRILDIGAGADPITADAVVFDKADGDAQELREPADAYDVVFSSHCIEHMPRPLEALLSWWRLVKPGGLMIIIGPDEDAYEQRCWPSIRNDEHCHSFTLLKQRSWCPASLNFLDLIRHLPDVKVVRAEIIDERPADADFRDWTLEGCICHIELVLQKLTVNPRIGTELDQVTRCPQCAHNLTLVGHKGLVLHLRCQHCGALVKCDMGVARG